MDTKQIDIKTKPFDQDNNESRPVQTVDGWWFLKIHLLYDSKLIK